MRSACWKAGAGRCCASLLLVTVLAVCAAENRVKDEIQVEVTGTLHTGMMAIGGETTGTVIVSGDVTWELDLGRNPDLRSLAEKLNGKKVTVTGTYQRRSGVEIPRREIVLVSTLAPARGARDSKKGP